MSQNEVATGEVIFIVEDDENLRSQIKENLEGAGFHTDCASKGAEAIERITTDSNIVLLLDFNLPDMTAVQVLRIISKAQREVPSIVLMDGDEKDTAEMMNLGAHDHLLKDDKSMDLLPQVRGRVNKEMSIERRLGEMEADLREAQESVSSMMTHIPGMAYRCHNDKDRTITFVNEGCVELTGYQPSDLLENNKTSFVQLIHEDDRKLVSETIGSALKEKSPFQLAYRIHTAKGEEKWIWDNGSGMYSPDGDLQSVEGFIADITEQKNAEEALSETKGYQNIFNDVNIGLFRWETNNGKLIECNKQFASIVGYDSQEECVADYLAFAHFVDPAACEQLFTTVTETGAIEGFEACMTRRDGSEVWVRYTVRLNQEKDCIEGLMSDITDSKQAGGTAGQAEGYFQAIMENSSEAIVVIDADGTIRYQSPPYERMLGHEPGASSVTSLFESIHPDDAPKLADEFAWLFKHPDSPLRTELRVQHTDGSWRTLAAIGHDLTNNPAIQGLVFNVRDITEQEQAEEALHAAEQRFTAVVENTSDIVAILSSEGIIIYDSPSAEQILGYDPQELTGKPLRDFVHPEDVANASGVVATVINRPGAPVSMELRFRHKDGSWRWIEGVANNLLDDPAVNGILITYRDITERRSLRQEQQERLASLEHQNQILTNSYTNLEEAMAKAKQAEDEFKAYVQDLSAKNHELEAAKQQLTDSNQKLEQTLADANNAKEEQQSRLSSLEQQVRTLTTSKAELEQSLAQAKQAQDELNTMKSQSETLSAKVNELEASTQQLTDSSQKLEQALTQATQEKEELQTQLADLEQQDQTLSASKTELEQSLAQANKAHDEVTARYEALSAKINELEAARQQLADLNQILDQALAKATQEKEDQQTRLADLEQQNQTLSTSKTELGQSLAQANKAHDEVTAQYEALSAKINELEAGRQKLTDSNQELEQALTNADEAKEEQQARLSSLEEQNQALTASKAELEQSLAQAKQAHDELNNLRSQSEALSAKINELEAGRQKLTDSNQELEQALTNANKAKEEQQSSLSSLEEQNQALTASKAELEQSLAQAKQAQDELNTLRAQSEALSAKVNELEAGRQQLADSNQKLEQTLADANNAKEEQQYRLSSLEQQVQTLTTSKAELEHSLAQAKQAQDELNTLRAQSEALSAKVNELEAGRQHLADSNQKLEQSLADANKAKEEKQSQLSSLEQQNQALATSKTQLEQSLAQAMRAQEILESMAETSSAKNAERTTEVENPITHENEPTHSPSGS